MVHDDWAERRVLRVERPWPSAERRAEIVLQSISSDGDILRRHRLFMPVTRISKADRDSIEATIVRGASFDGARRLDGVARRRIAEFVADIPDYAPAFVDAAPGPDGAVWLRLARRAAEPSQTWLVVDSLLQPVATGTVPENVVPLSFLNDRSRRATLSGDDGISYVARLSFTSRPSRAGAALAQGGRALASRQAKRRLRSVVALPVVGAGNATRAAQPADRLQRFRLAGPATLHDAGVAAPLVA